ncbi:MAG: hypothetical protein ACTSWM_03100 [Alphaproteobacteria bacterium]
MKSATLTSTLLARKGTAGPSRLRKLDPETVELRSLDPPAKSLTDISLAGGRQGTTESPEPEGGRARPIRAIAMRKTVAPKPRTGQTVRVKMSLRLDRARHAQLRKIAARTGRHMQDIMSVALDRYLEDLGKSSPIEMTIGGDAPAREIK